MSKPLTDRQRALYKFLMERGDVWTQQWYIASCIPEYGYDYKKEDVLLFHDTAARIQMTLDVRAINENDEVEKIIISSKRGIKLANNEEFDRHIRKEIMSVVRRLMRAKRKAEKGALNNQYKITFDKYERDYIEAFLSEQKK